eukprot:CAMPEP_0115091802 /NCGR_PEP_ID=MMETSP0227-20121206/26340_1 /TAXON_ID=89957 /ORGANISM="Polarella glacialis, Strain CCMP 1383" /LENGTH=72 /DNA_ID=CAMNT_0002483405 /DNA_START=19 /DNA_END=237 /DNA_ORIENTATION=-
MAAAAAAAGASKRTLGSALAAGADTKAAEMHQEPINRTSTKSTTNRRLLRPRGAISIQVLDSRGRGDNKTLT